MQKFNVTRNAINQMSQIIKKDNNYIGFIYSATYGGCNGFNFHLELIKSDLPNLNNYKINKFDNISIYSDSLSEFYILGTTIDYLEQNFEKNQLESKFIFHVDPKLYSCCGCGKSFSLKE